MKRPRPVLILTSIGAALTAVIGVAGAADLIPQQVMAWLILANAGVTAVLGVVAQGRVTPLSDPLTADGRPLVAPRIDA